MKEKYNVSEEHLSERDVPISLQSTYNLQSFGIATASLRSASRPFLSLVISSNFKMKNITKFEIPYLEEVMTL
tara:strand:- start:236 stop:454 length:219 start_codon:yes stop_codon:yes gene_type:complete